MKILLVLLLISATQLVAQDCLMHEERMKNVSQHQGRCREAWGSSNGVSS